MAAGLPECVWLRGAPCMHEVVSVHVATSVCVTKYACACVGVHRSCDRRCEAAVMRKGVLTAGRASCVVLCLAVVFQAFCAVCSVLVMLCYVLLRRACAFQPKQTTQYLAGICLTQFSDMKLYSHAFTALVTCREFVVWWLSQEH